MPARTKTATSSGTGPVRFRVVGIEDGMMLRQLLGKRLKVTPAIAYDQRGTTCVASQPPQKQPKAVIAPASRPWTCSTSWAPACQWAATSPLARMP